MIKKMIIFVFLALLISCKSQNLNSNNTNNGKIEYVIIFANGFKDAIINLSLNDMEVIKNCNLNTNESDGVTDIWLEVIKKSGKYYISISNESKLEIVNLKNDRIELKLLYKGTQEIFTLKKQQGNFLVINDNGKGKLLFDQKAKRPIFD